jgi:hypothetical protein
MPNQKTILACPCLALLCLLFSFPCEQNPDQEQKPVVHPTFRAQVDMISIPVVVSSKAGNRVTNLTSRKLHN